MIDDVTSAAEELNSRYSKFLGPLFLQIWFKLRENELSWFNPIQLSHSWMSDNGLEEVVLKEKKMRHVKRYFSSYFTFTHVDEHN